MVVMLFIFLSFMPQLAKKTKVAVSFDAVFTPAKLFFRVFHFPRVCGKQKNNQQTESWLDGAISSSKTYRQGHTPIQADSPHQAHHNGFVAYVWLFHDASN